MSANLLDLSGRIDARTVAIFDAIAKVTAANDGFDYERAGARLLGRDMATWAAEGTKQTLIDILAQETGKSDRFRLVRDMTTGTDSESFDDTLLLLQALEQGLVDTNGL